MFILRHSAELDECSRLVKILKDIVAITDAVSLSEESLSNGSPILKSCELIKHMDRLINELPGFNTEIGSGQVCRILRRESSIIRYKVHIVLN